MHRLICSTLLSLVFAFPPLATGAPPRAPAEPAGSTIAPASASPTQRILFTNLSETDGLSPGAVRGIIQDRQGFIWIATSNGLDRYDGYEIRHYSHDPGDPGTISGNDITAIFKDTRGQLWIGTRERGLNHFDTYTEKITRFRHDPSDSTTLSHDTITSISQDSRGGLWVGTPGGLNRFDYQNKTFERFPADPADPGTLSPDNVTAIHEDGRSRLWIGTAGGDLLRFDPETRTFISVWKSSVAISFITSEDDNGLWVGTLGAGLVCHRADTGEIRKFNHEPGNPRSLAGRDVRSILIDSGGILWAATDHGLCRMDPTNESFTTFRNHPLDSRSLTGNAVTTLFEDKKEILWVGTSRGGISRFLLHRRWFPHHRFSSANPSRLRSDSVWGMCQDSSGIVWIGSESGLNRYDPATGELRVWPLNEVATADPTGPYIKTLLEDSRKRLWLGTAGSGLLRLNPERKALAAFRSDLGDPSALPGDTVTALAEDSAGRIWVATQAHGLALYNESTASFISHQPDTSITPVNAAARFVTTIHPTAGTRLWLGTTDSGLFAYDPGKSRTTHYEGLPRVTGQLSSTHVSVLGAAEGGGLWIGTLGGGLNHFDPSSGIIKQYASPQSGIPHRDIYGIVPTAEGPVWLSTGSGISRFDPATESVRNFDLSDGLQGERFHAQSFLAGRDGDIYFGGNNGFNRINPANLPAERKSQRAILTGLELFGDRVLPTRGGVLEKPLALTDVLSLSYDPRNRLGLSFATLHYAVPHNSRFRYRLEGLDDTWTAAGAEQKASYTGLAPGEYTFLVQSSLDGEQWNEDSARLRIQITPPWHGTSWARALFAILAFCAFFSALALRTRIVSEKSRRCQAELEMDRNKAETALARQLQHAMLLGQTNQNFRHNMSGGEVFEQTLRHLGSHFEIDRCHIHSYGADPEPHSELLAEHSSPPRPSVGGVRFLEATNPLVMQIVASDNAIVSGDIRTDPAQRSVRKDMIATETRSFAAVRTSHLDQPNGFIMLECCGETPRPWEDDEIQLLEAVAGQVGIAIAHLQLSRKEEEQRRELEDAKREAEVANHAKSDFLAKMTHELRTPLNSIIGFSQMIHEDDATTGKQRELINIVNSSGEHLLDIINNILEMSKIEAGRDELIPERFDLRDLLASVIDMLRPRSEAQGLTLDLEMVEPVPRAILADKGKIRQILTNLIGNSLKFTQSGSITLSVAAEYDRTQDDFGNVDPLRSATRGMALKFEVRDTGKGISEEELPTLFEKFVQTDSGRDSRQGTGLGLAITRSFIQLMGGSISAKSTLGQGTTFAFEIRCHEIVERSGDRLPTEKARRPKELAPDHEEIRILVADDQPMNRLLAVRILEKAGFAIMEAENGAVAVEKWREWRPHLVLMDEEMPIMRGREATATILEEAGTNPPVIIALTAYALEDARLAALQAGSKDFLAKPFTHEALFEIIGKHLEIRYLYHDEAPVVGC